MALTGNVNIVIGSWGSYTSCNNRALGSDWLDLSLYSSWEEIEEELKKQGFDLEGIDEELFIQDIEGIPTDNVNWDYVNPQALFEMLLESEILNDDYKYEVFEAYIEVYGYRCWEDLVNQKGSRWDDDIILYSNMDFSDLAYHMIHEVYCYEIPKWLENYIDYKAYGRDLSFEGFHEYSNGIIEIR